MTPAGHTHSHPIEPGHDTRPRESSLVHPSVPAQAVAGASLPISEAPAAIAPRFSMRVGTNDDPTESGHALAGSSGGDATLDPNGTPFPEAGVSVPARLLGSGSPAYPAAARLAEV